MAEEKSIDKLYRVLKKEMYPLLVEKREDVCTILGSTGHYTCGIHISTGLLITYETDIKKFQDLCKRNKQKINYDLKRRIVEDWIEQEQFHNPQNNKTYIKTISVKEDKDIIIIHPATYHKVLKNEPY